jgi:hypothetical protein
LRRHSALQQALLAVLGEITQYQTRIVGFAGHGGVPRGRRPTTDPEFGAKSGVERNVLHSR